MRFNYIYILGLLSLLVFSQCNSSTGQAEGGAVNTVTVAHKLGNTDVPAEPQRIVVLDIGALETLHELGMKPVATSKKHLPTYLDVVRHDESIGDVGSIIEPDFERINSFAPDLILMSTRQQRFYDELSHIAPAVFIGTDNADYLNSFRQNVELLGRIVGKEELAKQKLAEVEAKIEAAQAKFADNSNRALFLIYNNGSFSAFGTGSRFGFIHDVLHLKPTSDHVEESVHGQKMSNELIATTNPDYIFVVDRNAAVLGKKANKAEVENKLIQQTNAYKNDKIFYLDPNVWFISGGGLSSVDLMVDDIVELLLEER